MAGIIDHAKECGTLFDGDAGNALITIDFLHIPIGGLFNLFGIVSSLVLNR